MASVDRFTCSYKISERFSGTSLGSLGIAIRREGCNRWRTGAKESAGGGFDK